MPIQHRGFVLRYQSTCDIGGLYRSQHQRCQYRILLHYWKLEVGNKDLRYRRNPDIMYSDSIAKNCDIGRGKNPDAGRHAKRILLAAWQLEALILVRY